MKNINWKLRLQNKVTLVTLVITLVGLAYQVLSLFGVVPAVSQEQVVNVLLTGVEIFAILGIVVDPTTKGIDDSERALTYDKPNNDSEV